MLWTVIFFSNFEPKWKKKYKINILNEYMNNFIIKLCFGYFLLSRILFIAFIRFTYIYIFFSRKPEPIFLNNYCSNYCTVYTGLYIFRNLLTFILNFFNPTNKLNHNIYEYI